MREKRDEWDKREKRDVVETRDERELGPAKSRLSRTIHERRVTKYVAADRRLQQKYS